ncbi:hypothetical protein MYIN104542_14700 [Mycobacterium intermedium]
MTDFAKRRADPTGQDDVVTKFESRSKRKSLIHLPLRTVVLVASYGLDSSNVTRPSEVGSGKTLSSNP